MNNKSNQTYYRVSKQTSISALLCLTLALSSGAFASGGGIVTDDPSSIYQSEKKQTYSPYAGRNFPDRPLWGDTHLHTALSFDAGAFGATLLPPDAYKFAKGEEVISSTGQPVRLSRPLDFLVVADHSDNMGFITELKAGAPFVMESDKGRRWNTMINKGGQESVKATVEMITAFSQDQFPKELAALPGTSLYRNTWDNIIKAAEDANDPGHFTAFIGYEWTSLVKGNNLHRNIIYRDGATRAKLLEPFTTAAPLGSTNPVDLWKWMDR